MIPELADLIGYSPRDGIKRARVHTAVGEEEGYVLRVAELAVLGVVMTRFPINVFDLGHDDIDGLLGMNFLSEFNFEIRPTEQRILIEKIAP
jgi:predicted aspartyl protease